MCCAIGGLLLMFFAGLLEVIGWLMLSAGGAVWRGRWMHERGFHDGLDAGYSYGTFAAHGVPSESVEEFWENAAEADTEKRIAKRDVTHP